MSQSTRRTDTGWLFASQTESHWREGYARQVLSARRPRQPPTAPASLRIPARVAVKRRAAC
jgi:hypothetical protein